ncbi:MAG: hypothetical protein AAGE01_09485 [Pseudomonadota bacterium]
MDSARRHCAALIFALVALGGSQAAEARTVFRCIAPDFTVSYQEMPCPAGTAELELPVDEHDTDFGGTGDTPADEPAAEQDSATIIQILTGPEPDPGAELVTWEELECHAVGYFGVRRHYPFFRNAPGAACHTIQRTATRRDRCRQLDAYHEEYRVSSITWRDRREELIEAKNQMAAVGCCNAYSDTSLGNARALPCQGARAFDW